MSPLRPPDFPGNSKASSRPRERKKGKPRGQDSRGEPAQRVTDEMSWVQVRGIGGRRGAEAKAEDGQWGAGD